MNENKFAFKRGIYERVWTNEEHTSCTHKHVGDMHYTVELVNDETIRVTRDNEPKDVLVRDDWDFVYSLKKGYIRARDKATGLYEHLKDCVHENGEVWNSASLYTVCDWVIDEMKPIGKRPPETMNKARFEDAAKHSANIKEQFVDIADGWMVSIQYSKRGACYACLRNNNEHVEYEFYGVFNDTKAGYVKAAMNGLWNQYESKKAA